MKTGAPKNRIADNGCLVALVMVFLVGIPSPAKAALVNRWSFNDPAGDISSGAQFLDSVSGAPATIRGSNSLSQRARFTGTAIELRGTTNGELAPASIAAYIDLPNGIISSKKDLTVEIWATPDTARSWMRIFDFGRVSGPGDGLGEPGEITGTSAFATGGTVGSDDLVLTFTEGTNLGNQALFAILNGGNGGTVESALPTFSGTQYHYVATFEDGIGVYGSAGGQATWYRNGIVIGTFPVSFHLKDIEDVNNWLGRSQWSQDSLTDAFYDEVRIYDHALSLAEITANRNAGPDVIPDPLPQPPPLAPANPVNRWSFNDPAGAPASGTTFTDNIGGVLATLRGVGATTNGSAITLPGTTDGVQNESNISAYIDLPNGIFSSKPDLTVEFWAAPLSSRSYQRLIDFGRCTATFGGGATGEIVDKNNLPPAFQGYAGIGLSLNTGDVFGQNTLIGQFAGGPYVLVEPDLSQVTIPGAEYHYVVTVEDRTGIYGAGGCAAKFYRDGVLQTVLYLSFRLPQISDVNNWIGRSQWSHDPNANVAVNEFRIYDRALTREEIELSYQRGPEASFDPPVTAADSATIHAGQKVRIDVLANDTGNINPGTVEIVDPPSVGSATVDSSGRILYVHAGNSPTPVNFTYRVYGNGGYSAPTPVTVSISNSLRIANPALKMPTEPPSSVLQVVDAIPGVTFNEPICIASVPGDTKRLFVCERMADIQVVPDITADNPTQQVFLNILQVVAGRSPTETIEGGFNQENGVLGLAFHPNYASNGYFYVAYTVRISGGPYYQRISRFKVSTGDPNVADPDSELILLQQYDEGANHNGGDLHFGPDGYLYYAAGDEDNPNDHLFNSQTLTKDFFAGIFRIDVDKKPGNLEPNAHASIPTDSGIARFSVPIDNPFVHTSLGGTWDGTYNGFAVSPLGSVRTEFWATGLRHPWRMSFDPLTGDLWAGDVGQDTWEEVNVIVKGGNYGWVHREAAHNTNLRNPVPAGFSPIDPVYEYPHPAVAGANPLYSGNSVCGGYVYRGTRFTDLYGAYIFADSVTGHIWKRDPGNGVVTRITGVPGAYGGIVSMGVDPSNQDLLFCDYINGRILRMATATIGNSFPATLSETGLFADVSDLSPSPGLLPFEANLPFWSDYAVKRRFFGIASATDKLTWARDANWTFPTGMLWVKHFDLETERGNPATKRRIETRVLVKTDDSVYGVSYRWNDDQTEATLAPEEGIEFNVPVVDGGIAKVQRWGIPSRTSCVTCHTPQAGGSLSFTTRQLNRENSINGFEGNQLTLLRNGGYFANDPGSPNVLPYHVRADQAEFPLEARVRSYLAVNCAYCHREDGTVAGSNWDGRPELSLAETNLINGNATNNHGNPANKYVVPGDLTHSIVYNRVAVQNGFTRMPPIASNELDPADIALLDEWITTTLPNRKTYTEWRVEHFGSDSTLEGERTENPDGDLSTNNGEFLGDTDPNDGGSFPIGNISIAGSNVSLGFDLPIDRIAQVWTSSDLVHWELWDAPGNDGMSLSPGEILLTAPMVDDNQFFKVDFREY